MNASLRFYDRPILFQIHSKQHVFITCRYFDRMEVHKDHITHNPKKFVLEKDFNYEFDSI
jgi:hypothetical protein